MASNSELILKGKADRLTAILNGILSRIYMYTYTYIYQRTTASIISDASSGCASSLRNVFPKCRCHKSNTSIGANPSAGRSRKSRLRLREDRQRSERQSEINVDRFMYIYIYIHIYIYKYRWG